MKCIDKTLAPGHIDPLPSGVIVEVIGVLHTGKRGDHLTGLRVEYSHARRFVRSDEQAVIRLVERHGEVVLERQRPTGDRMRAAIDDRDLFQVRQVDIDIRSCRFQLERFRMRSQLVFFVGALVGRCIHSPDGRGLLVAVTDVDTLVRRVVPQIIDITVEVDRRDQIERRSVVDVKLAFAARHKQLVHFRGIDHALGVGHARDRVVQCSPADIDDLDRIVAQRGDEQLPPTRAKMVETSLNVLQRDRLRQNQRPDFRSCQTLLSMKRSRPRKAHHQS